ncbi:MAG: hypothetical protein H0U53_07875 [Actinobacteria bacterium]|nr:hypothetical protein [Actinomycetota bacterium]
MLPDLRVLLAEVEADAGFDDYRTAVLDENVLGKRSLTSRQRSLRYLRELYSLDLSQLTFRPLRDLWAIDPAGQPLLAILSAVSRDSTLRATAEVVLPAQAGTHIASHDLEKAVEAAFPGAYSQSVANKIGRNTASSWTQSGHLDGRSYKTRTKAVATPGSAAYALMLAHLTGTRGHGLFESVLARTLDATSAELHALAGAASARGWIEYKRFGDVIEVGFRWLLRDEESILERN